MKYDLRPARQDECDFAFEVKRDAMGPHIRAQWAWDEEFQRRHHGKRWAEKPWFIVSVAHADVGAISLHWHETHLQLGEFYLLSSHRGQGLGSKILFDTLAQADKRGLETRLEFLKWNPVGPLYIRHGFEVVGESEIHFFAVRRANAA